MHSLPGDQRYMSLPTLDVSQETQQELDREVRSHPEISSIQSDVKKNWAVSEILFDSSIAHVTQNISAALNEKAFSGKSAAELKEAGDEDYMKFYAKAEAEADQLMKDHAEFAEREGVVKEDLLKELGKLWIYYRLTHPILEQLEKSISRIEGSEATVAVPSGLSALDVLLDQYVKTPGLIKARNLKTGEEKELHGALLQHDEWKDWEFVDKIEPSQILIVGAVYGGSHQQLVKRMEQRGIRTIFMPISKFIEEGAPDGTTFIINEISNNPILRVSEMEKTSDEKKRLEEQSGKRVHVISDNTFTTGTVRPLDHGADFVINSATKYYSGRSEDMGGFISGSASDLVPFLSLEYGERMVDGPVMSLSTVRNYLKNIQDLYERLYLATKNARAVKKIAEKYGLKVRHIESDDVPGYSDRYAKVKNPKIPDSISNGMLMIDFESVENAFAVSDALEDGGVGSSCVSLGGVHTYYCNPATTTHSELSPEEQKKATIKPGMLRMSCGIEEDLPSKFEEVCERLFPEREAVAVAAAV
jgi:cystathionine beta-lyase/cystathionine gamma-synthase